MFNITDTISNMVDLNKPLAEEDRTVIIELCNAVIEDCNSMKTNNPECMKRELLIKKEVKSILDRIDK
jgi:hypothetical protein